MKKHTIASVVTVLIATVACLSGSASAGTYSFEDTIDTWGLLGVDATRITQSGSLTYTHDLNQEVDFAAGDLVTELYLELDFTNDRLEGDAYKLTGVIKYDFREFVTVLFDGTTWIQVDGGEDIDDDAYSVVLNVDWVNDDGLLDVTVNVSNALGTGTIWLDHSRLYGTAATPEVAAVPVPGALLLGMVGLATTRKLRRLF